MKKLSNIVCFIIAAVLLAGPVACYPVLGDSDNQTSQQQPQDGNNEQTPSPEPDPQPDPVPDPEPTIMERIREACPSITALICERTEETYKGVRFTETSFQIGSYTNQMFILEINLNQDVTLRACTPENRPICGLKADMLAQAASASKAGCQVLYGVNADFFGTFGGDGKMKPMGVVYVDGKAYQSKSYGSNNVFYIRKDGSADIAKINTFEAELSNVWTAVSGFQTLVWDGYKSRIPNDDLAKGLHPRTFIGISKDRKSVYIFVVDGRQSGYSKGLCMSDMADMCLGAGCDRAFNLDGGGSTTLVRAKDNGFALLNRPSDAGNKPRPVVDGLLVVKKN